MRRGNLSRAGFAVLSFAMAGGMHAAGAVAPQKPESLYVGYYQEDPIDNPEDPTVGALYLKLPDSGSAFAGNMFFTYVGCQRSNVGTITGTKAGERLQGTWSGTTDGTAQHGNFTGSRIAGHDAYTGTYSVAGGKQHIVVGDCIEYFIASKGTFELFAAGTSEPASFAITLRDNVVSWTAPPGALMTLVSIIDPDVARTGRGNATLWQTLVMGAQHTANVRGVTLTKAHAYLATVGAVDQSFKRIAFGSTEFTAQ